MSIGTYPLVPPITNKKKEVKRKKPNFNFPVSGSSSASSRPISPLESADLKPKPPTNKRTERRSLTRTRAQETKPAERALIEEAREKLVEVEKVEDGRDGETGEIASKGAKPSKPEPMEVEENQEIPVTQVRAQWGGGYYGLLSGEILLMYPPNPTPSSPTDSGEGDRSTAPPHTCWLTSPPLKSWGMGGGV